MFNNFKARYCADPQGKDKNETICNQEIQTNIDAVPHLQLILFLEHVADRKICANMKLNV